MNRIQQLAGIKIINENLNSPEAIEKDILSYNKKGPEEVKKWVEKYAQSVANGDWNKAEALRIALNVIKEKGIKI